MGYIIYFIFNLVMYFRIERWLDFKYDHCEEIADYLI